MDNLFFVACPVLMLQYQTVGKYFDSVLLSTSQKEVSPTLRN